MSAKADDAEEESRKRPRSSLTEEGNVPQKRFYRQRAHCNPLSHNDTFDYPAHPDMMDWRAELYPTLDPSRNPRPTVLDIGCGFGGLTMALAPLLPNQVILGMEIRAKVTEYVRLRIMAERQQNDTHHNASVMRTNSMKFLPNYFPRGSLQKLFFCFPDPHFKRKNHPRRIISERLLSEYAYLLEPGRGLLYSITDVLELHEWHVDKCSKHPLFEALSADEMEADPCVQAMKVETEEGKKVARNAGRKYFAVYRRITRASSKVSAATFSPR